MSITRRHALALPALLPGVVPRAARAQENWPTRSLRLIVPFTPAGTTDIAARVVAEPLGRRLGQQVVVENRPGAGGNIGAEAVAKGEFDGHTILLATVSTAGINPTLYGARMPYRPEELAAVGLILRVPNVIFCANTLPVRTLRELVEYAKARPGQLNFGSSGIGTSLHLTGELLKQVSSIDMTHVPFRGASPMMAEVISGRIEVGADNLPSCIGHLQDGRFRALALTAAARSPALPDCPTTAEQGFPTVETTAWFGIQAPARVPRAIIARLGAELDAVVKMPAVQARFTELGGLPPGLTPDGGTSPESFATFIAAEQAKWGEVIRRSGATAE